MSRWTHPICDECWNAQNPGQRVVRVTDPVMGGAGCCWCGEPTEGIFTRSDPETTPCGGEGPEHDVAA